MGRRTWTVDKGVYLKQLFLGGQADPNHTTPTYMKTIFESYPIFNDRTLKLRNFYCNYRRLATEFITNTAKTGLRRKGK